MIKKSQQHLEQANEHYFEHMIIALKISLKLLIAAVMTFIHSLLPSLFQNSASSRIKNYILLLKIEIKLNNYK
tara:strand:+ start:426 stop:644 length:219 start_codon:yes stop_codon:yes gene_type:complete